VAALLDTYMQRVGATLDGWLRNIVEADATSEPLSTGEGRMWTPGAVDLFRILDEQVSVVTATRAGGALLLRVGDEAVRVMRAFQRGCRARLGALPLEHLCAVANNSLRCHHLGEEFAARLNATCLSQGVDGAPAASAAPLFFFSKALLLAWPGLAWPGLAWPRRLPLQARAPLAADHLSTPCYCVFARPAGQVDVLEACQAFVELSQEAAAACVGIVFSDPGLVELVGRVACTEQWATGVATSSVLATLEDFLQDFRRWLEPPPFQHAVDLMRAEAAAHFLAALTTQLRAVREDSLRAVRQDAAKLAAFFAPFSSSSAAARACQPLVSAAEFLAADSVEAFVLGYTALLESAPGITPTLLANLLAARVAGDSGMTKADSKEVRVWVGGAGGRGGGEGGGAGRLVLAGTSENQLHLTTASPPQRLTISCRSWRPAEGSTRRGRRPRRRRPGPGSRRGRPRALPGRAGGHRGARPPSTPRSTQPGSGRPRPRNEQPPADVIASESFRVTKTDRWLVGQG
jgi:hypothetical protein